MAEINRQDIITEEAIRAPLEMADNIGILMQSITKLIDTTKKSEQAINGNTSSASGLTKETQGLTQAQTELEKIQKQYATSTQKLSDEYLSNKRALNAINQEVRDKIALGEKDAKAITAQTSSLKELENALKKNRQAYSELANEQARGSKNGQELLKIIQSQDKASKELSQSMGQANKEVGNYKGQIEKALGSISKIAPATAEMASEGVSKFSLLEKFISGPVIASLAAVFAAFEVIKTSIQSYTSDTAEGAAKAKEFKAEWIAAQELIRQGFVELGKTILGFDNLDRSTGEGFLTTSLRMLGMFKTAEKLADQTREQLGINKANKLVREEEIELIVKGEALQLTSAKALFEARDKIRNTDMERLAALDKGEKAILEKEKLEKDLVNDKILAFRDYLKSRGAEFTADQKAIDLLHDKTVLQHVNKDQIEELAKLEAELDKIEEGFFQSSRRRQALRQSAFADLEKKAIETLKAELNANDKTQTALLNTDIDTQTKIIGNQTHSLKEQITALEQFEVDHTKLVQLGAEKEKRAAADAAFARVEIDTKAYREISDSAKLSNIQKLQLIFDLRVKAVHEDKAYQDEIKAIDLKASEESQKIVRDGNNQTAKLITDNYQHFIDLRKQFNKQDTNELIKGLDEQLKAGEITLRQYNIRRNKIDREYTQEDFKIQIDEQKQALQVLETFLKRKGSLTDSENKLLLKIQSEISNAEVAQVETTTKRIEVALQKRHDLVIGLQNELFQSILGVGNNMFASEQQQDQFDLQRLANRRDEEIKMAGDNAESKKQIEEKYALQSAAISKKLLESRQKQARFDRDVAEVQVAVKTAEAIADALPLLSNPITFAIGAADIALITAIGAAQEAVIISRPIPLFEKGTKNAPGGLSVVGEKGSELLYNPSTGKVGLSPSVPTVMDITRGTVILPHDETMRHLAMASINSESGITNDNSLVVGVMKALRKTIKDSSDKTVKAIQNNGNGNFFRQGSELYEAKKISENQTKIIRRKSLSE